jgi:pimeloyl-ACP methyl ester carboxylesterase
MGSGPLDLVLVVGWISHLDLGHENPRIVRFLERLSSFCRLIVFDKRGTGLSDRVSTMPTLEQRMDDVRAVMDAVGSERAAIFGYSEGGPMSILFSATYPKRTSALILYGSMARWSWAPDNPWGRTDEQFQARARMIEEYWGQGKQIEMYAKNLVLRCQVRGASGR